MPLDRGRAMTEEEFRLLRELIYDHCGLTFGEDNLFQMQRRLGQRLAVHGLPDFTAYYRYLRFDAGRRAELEMAAELLTTNETYFYREPHQLRAFAEEILPSIAEENHRDEKLRIWSAGCSTGEEAYTIAILLKKCGLFEGWNLDVFGSDIARRVLAIARAGVYGENAFRTPEAEAIRLWFREEESKWHVRDMIRKMVSFGHLNLLDPVAAECVGATDVIFCRNVMIYFDLEARRRVVRTFWNRLREGGYLLLGHSESLLNVTTDFEIVQLRHDLVYRKPKTSP
jgi:chemotaxis protein methyltransferase CheR